MTRRRERESCTWLYNWRVTGVTASLCGGGGGIGKWLFVKTGDLKGRMGLPSAGNDVRVRGHLRTHYT